MPDPSVSAALASGSKPFAPLPSTALLTQVSDALAPRRLVTVRQLVVPPIYVPVAAEVLVATRPDVAVTTLQDRLKSAIEGWLDALAGGPEGEGWPFGRDVYTAEIYRLLEKVPGVDFVSDVVLSSPSTPTGPRVVQGQELWHEGGDQIGIELAAHHLPWAQIDSSKILIGSRFLAVRVHVKAAAENGVDLAEARRKVRTEVKLLFHWPAGAPQNAKVTGVEIRDKVEALAEIKTGAVVTVQADPSRLFSDGVATGVRFEAGEMADVTVTVEV